VLVLHSSAYEEFNKEFFSSLLSKFLKFGKESFCWWFKFNGHGGQSLILGGSILLWAAISYMPTLTTSKACSFSYEGSSLSLG